MNKNTKWDSQRKTAKATQVAFELEQKIARQLHGLAAKEGLTPSSQIRKLLGLSFSPPKRPRLTVSLSAEDYEVLGKKYKIAPSETLEIRRKIMQELIQNFEK